MYTTDRNVSSSDDIISVEDIIARIDELESSIPEDDSERDAWGASDEGIECTILESLLSDLKGNGGDLQHKGDWYPQSLIRESHFVEAMAQLCEDIGDFPDGIPSYYVIDWEATARNLKVDYSAVEFDGVTYYYR